MKTIHAIFEGGVFRPLETVELPERTEVVFAPVPAVHEAEIDGSLDAIYAILSERYESGDNDVAARHDEHCFS